MSHNEIEFVYFDLGNILVSFDPQTACQNVKRLFAVDVTRAQAVIYDSGLQVKFEHGQVSGPQFAQQVRHDLSLTSEQMPTAALLDAVSAMFTPIESMSEIVAAVANSKRIGILSNTCRAHWDWIVRQNWSVMNSPFEVHVLSYEVGAMKPAPQIYQAAEAAAGVEPSKILFLDDRGENVEGAVARGWTAVQCVGGPSAATALMHHGVLI